MLCATRLAANENCSLPWVYVICSAVLAANGFCFTAANFSAEGACVLCATRLAGNKRVSLHSKLFFGSARVCFMLIG